MHWRPYFSTRGFGKPQGPLILKRVLNIEVILIVENSHRLVTVLGLGALTLAIGRDGDCGKVNLLVHIGSFGGSGHCVLWLLFDVCGLSHGKIARG